MAVSGSENPFFNRGCIEEERYFCGRERELREILNLLGKPSPQSVSIVGQRRIGKSSILRHVCRPNVLRRYLPDPDRLVMIHVSCESMAYLSELECLQKIMWETHAALTERGIVLGEELKIDLGVATTFRITEGLGRLFRHLRLREKRHVVFVLDEFEVACFNPHLSLGFFNTLRSFASTFGVAYLVATRQELWQLPHSRMGRSSPFFNYFTTLFLTLFKGPEAEDAISRLAADSGVSLAAEVPFMLRKAGMFPFFLQMLCWYLWEKVAEGGPLSDEGREQAYQQLVVQSTGHFDFFWGHLTDEEKAVAERLSRGQPVLVDDAPRLESLERKALVARPNREPALFCDAFKAFVRSAGASTVTPGRAADPTA